jgi:hypothetical protein
MNSDKVVEDNSDDEVLTLRALIKNNLNSSYRTSTYPSSYYIGSCSMSRRP